MVKLGVLQLQIRKDEDNFDKIEELINEVKEKSIEIVCLPEKWNAKAALDPIENLKKTSSRKDLKSISYLNRFQNKMDI